MTSDYAAGFDSIKNDMKKFYGNILDNKQECPHSATKLNQDARQAIKLVHSEIIKRYDGCGLVIPERLADVYALDLGCGAGRDSYLLSKLAGERGHVVGLDMTKEQLDVANEYVDYHTTAFSYSKPNIEFVQGYIEKLSEAGLQDNIFDVVISNCVVNLSPDKRAVLREVYRVLKNGGELYFSDMYADQVLPPEVRNNRQLWGHGYAGSLWWKDLYNLAAEIGFTKPRLVSANMLTVPQHMKSQVGGAQYASVTYRLYKLAEKPFTTPTKVVYKGTIPNCEKKFQFDHRTVFKAGAETYVDVELSNILHYARCKDDFEIVPIEKRESKISKESDDAVNPFNLSDQ